MYAAAAAVVVMMGLVLAQASNARARIGCRPVGEKASHDVNDCGARRTQRPLSPLPLHWSHTSHQPTMSSARLVLRSSRAALALSRPFATSAARFKDLNERGNDTTEEWRKKQQEKPLNPHMTNTNSTIANQMPSIGKSAAPPEMLSSVDPDFVPKDAKPENTERMTGGTQKGAPEDGVNAELGVGEIEGGQFKIEPIRRVGEDANTMRARLICPSLHAPSTLCSSR